MFCLQHEIVPSELIHRIASLKYVSLSLSYSPRKYLKIYDLNYISIDIYMVLIMFRCYVTKFCYIPIMKTACFLYEPSPCVFVKAWRYLQGAEELAQAQTVAS